jgi:hypothetical protein
LNGTFSYSTNNNSDDSLALLYPIGTTRPAYVHKLAAASTSGTIDWRRGGSEQAQTIAFDDALTVLGMFANTLSIDEHTH